MGMGIDNPDVRMVVQWHQPDSMCALLQRGGRAARQKDIYGNLLWLVEPWCIGPRKEDITVSNQAICPSQLPQCSVLASSPKLPPHSGRKVTKKLQEESTRRSNM